MSLQFLKTNSLFAFSVRVFQSLKISYFLPLISILSGRPMLVPISSCMIFDNSSISSTVETLVAAGCSGFSVCLDNSFSYSRLSISLPSGNFVVGGDLLLMRKYMRSCTFTATLLRKRYSTLLAFLNRSLMCIFQVRLSETSIPRSFTVFERCSF